MTLMQDKPAVKVPNLVNDLYEEATKRIGDGACHSVRASAIGHDCERYLVYSIANWEDATQKTVGTRLIFDEGNLHERAVLQSLPKAGHDVIEQQRNLTWREYNITGHVDGVLVVNGKAVVLEIKSMADHIWRGIFRDGPRAYLWMEVEEEFQGKPWLRKYYAQQQAYMILKEAPAAIMLCKNKQTGGYAQVNLELDYEYAEGLLQRAERINKHVADGTYPERIAWDAEVCGRCDFLHLCHPDRVNEDPIKFVEDAEAAKTLDQRGEAHDASKVYKTAHEWVVDWAWKKYPNKANVTVGNWLIEKSKGKGGRRLTNIKRLAEGGNDGD
jgi:hypothetical protein